MNVFIQGMRRSGTTILFDLFWEDQNFDCYYEPFGAVDKPALGGGSRMHAAVNYGEKIRHCRVEFMRQYSKLERMELLNYGAPRQPELEFETTLPDYCQAYLNDMIAQADHTVIKFTRMSCKVQALWDIDPHAKFIHIVRDPRLVTASYLFGKTQMFKDQFRNEQEFFRKISQTSSWSSYPLSEWILHTPEYRHLRRCQDFMRVLLIWKYTFWKTYETGKTLFKENYVLLRHEDVCHDPVKTVRSLYAFIGQPVPQAVAEWAGRHVQPAKTPFAAHHKQWRNAFKRLDMEHALELTGYADCLELRPPRRGPFEKIQDIFQQETRTSITHGS